MNTKLAFLLPILLALTLAPAGAAVRYVNLANPSPAPPYTSWASAATNIQDAIDAANAGDDILVSNGAYQPVVVGTPLSLRSVNGPVVTVIDGAGMGRCVYLTNSGMLAGFTLTNGVAPSGGGVRCESASAVVSNCVLTGNSAVFGGGAYGGTLDNCVLTGNSAAYACGGGVYGGTLNNCSLNLNSASSGGGAYAASLDNCTLIGNSAFTGGGAYECALNNCILYYNSARHTEANYYSSQLNNCCTAPMPAIGGGNITAEPLLTDLAHLAAGSPCRAAGSAAFIGGVDIDGEPWANQPPIGCDEFQAGVTTGSLGVAFAADYTTVTPGFTVKLTATLLGRASANQWEFGDGTIVSNRPFAASHSWTATGDYDVVFRAYNDSYLTSVSATTIVHVVSQPVHYVVADCGDPMAPYGSWATAAANIQDAVDAASVAGALVLVSNGVYQTGGRAVFGTMTNRVALDKPIMVRSVNGPEVTVIHGYQVPGMTNGDNAVRCVYLTNGAVLVGFTLTNGATHNSGFDWFEQCGGGVWCESTSSVVSNCVLSGNSARCGGGALCGTLNNCTLTSNSAAYGGGVALDAVLNNCALTGNSADAGGGAYAGTLNNCTVTCNLAGYCGGGASGQGGGGGLGDFTISLNNCIVYHNIAPSGANYCADSSGVGLAYCCTTPLPPFGLGNFDIPPLFMDPASGNLRLQAGSPCINAGVNSSAAASPDLDGNPRIVGGTVDVGAFEFQSPQSRISYAWLQQFGLFNDGSEDFTDEDGDGFNNWQEWRAGTDPTNAQSVLRLLMPAPAGSDLVVTWKSVPGRSYGLEGSANLSVSTPFAPLASHLSADPLAATTTFTHTNAATTRLWFYRVWVEE